jgi:hypothetical protein
MSRLAHRSLCAIAFAALLASCASRPPAELVPPRLELASFGAIGVVEFAATNAKGKRSESLGTAATREFVSSVHAAQPGTPLLELAAAAGAAPSPHQVRELAAREHVDAIALGEIVLSEATPRVGLDAAYGVASASARLKARIAVRLLDGKSGATLWSATSEREIPLMSAALTRDGLSNVDARSTEEARAILVRDLVYDVTGDLRARWVQR